MNGSVFKKVHIVHTVCSIAVCFFLAATFIHDMLTDTRQQQSAYSVIHWTDYEKEFSEAKTILSGTVRIDNSVGNVLAFYSSHQNIKVYSGTDLIYEYPLKNNNLLSDSPGYCWNFVHLPYSANNLKIEITSPYQTYLDNIPVFYIGNSFSLPAYIIDSDFVPFTLCVIMFVLGITLIVYHLTVVRTVSSDAKLLKLGTFSVFLSIWSANECSIAALLLKNNIVTSYLSFLALMLIPIPLATFIQTFYEDDGKIWKLFCEIDAVQIVVSIFLAVTKIADLRETLWATHTMMCALIIVIIIQSYRLIKSKNKVQSSMVKIHMVCVFVCCASVALDLFDYYFLNLGDGNTVGRLGFLSYIIVLGIESTKEAVALMKKGQEANTYQRLAYTDQMTGLKNRTCFNIDFERLSQNPHNVAVIDFDLNNLKYTNDTYGHTVGDIYIKSCATIIYNVFNKVGSCYRVGGDEFVVLIEEAPSIDIKQRLDKLESSVKTSNIEHEHLHLKMQIAYGCAIFDPDDDRTLEDTYNRADKIMYRDKREKKGKVNSLL